MARELSEGDPRAMPARMPEEIARTAAKLAVLEPVGPLGGPIYSYQGVRIVANAPSAVSVLDWPEHPMHGMQKGAPATWLGIIDLWLEEKKLPPWLSVTKPAEERTTPAFLRPKSKSEPVSGKGSGLFAALLAAGTLFGAVEAVAQARIEVSPAQGGVTPIVVSGLIQPGDEARFQDLTAGIGRARVYLSGPGGDVAASLRIGHHVRDRGFTTVVRKDSTCASAYMLIWAAGVPRTMDPRASLGAHAARSVHGPGEAGAANAVIGAYLSQMGLPYRAIAVLTKAAPNDLTELKASDLGEIGVTAVAYDDGSWQQPIAFMLPRAYLRIAEAERRG